MKARQKPEEVCPQTCPNRTVTCKFDGSCAKYAQYHQKQLEEYKKRQTAARIDGFAIDSIHYCKRKPPLILKYKGKTT